MFYMTWGRKNGDSYNAQFFPPLGTYEGMDSLLYLRYMMMKEDNNAAVSPVGRVWHYIRTNYPTIELYQSDESHPSMAGTYAAACSFLTAIWGVDPTMVTYAPAALDSVMAANIRYAAKTVVYDSLSRWQRVSADATFTTEVNENYVALTSANKPNIVYAWDFGDGTVDSLAVTAHKYTAIGTYTIRLIAANHCETDTMEQTVTINSISAVETAEADGVEMFPEVASVRTTIHSDVPMSMVRLISVNGMEVYRSVEENTETILALNAYAKGLYLVKITLVNGKETTKHLLVK